MHAQFIERNTAEDMDKEVALYFNDLKIPVTDLGEEASIPDLIGEKILQNRLKFDLEEDDDIYGGYGRLNNAYPYRQFNQYAKTLKTKEIKTAVLENECLTAVFLLEYGGRLWSLTDKKTGKNLLYTNDVLKFRNLAVRNAWFSGGVEWNIGIIGHTPYTTAPLYAAVLENGDVPVLRMYEYERIRKVYYQMDFWMEPKEPVLNCRMRIMNETQNVTPMYWWSNMAVPEFEKGKIIVPARKAFTFDNDRVCKVDIPYVKGTDILHYNNIPVSVDYFFDIEETEPKYIANVNEKGYGLLQLSTKRLKSRKLFSWGHTPASRHWQEFLTQDSGNYIEIQAGLGKTQYGCIPMGPLTAWEWMEQYGPIQLTPEQMAASHEDAFQKLTTQLVAEQRLERLEKKLRDTKEMARTKGRLIQKGSGYGAMEVQNKMSSHLEFALEEEGLKKWMQFRETGLLHCQSPLEKPDEFFQDDAVFQMLQKTIGDKNKENWYAHYHLGVQYCINGDLEKAEQTLTAAARLSENPWVCHGLGCLYLRKGQRQASAHWILKGLGMRKKDISYLKESFKLLLMNKSYAAMEQAYQELDAEEQTMERLKLYHVLALHQLGRYEEAAALLTEAGGILPEDIREGEVSIESLWKDLNEKLSGRLGEVPYQYLFRTY